MENFSIKKLNGWITFLVILGATLAATILAYYFVVIYPSYLDKDNGVNMRFLIVAATLLISFGCFVIALFLNASKARRKEYRAAYMDRNYHIYNENFFLVVVGRKRTRGKASGYIATLDIDRSKEVATTVNTATLEVTKQLTAICAKTLQGRYNAMNRVITYAYRSSGSFLLYIDDDDQKHVLSELEGLNKQISLNIVKENIASTLGYRACLCEDDGKSEIEELISKCEIARNSTYLPLEGNIIIFEENMIQKTLDEMTLAKDIEHAIKNHEFEVYYQPKFDLKNERFVGAEALVRWRHPTKGLVSPATFVPFAERNDQIIDIDRYCFERVCQDIAYWKKRGTRLLNISVNLSRNGIYRTDLIDFLSSTMDKFQVSPLLIEMELTESSAQRDMLYLLSVIKELKGLKLKLSVDDFGTGYSSLSNLRKLPMDTLKIDKSFFDSIEVDKKSRDIVKTTIAMAKALEMKVVAEGIQTAKQVAFLKGTDCDMIQGYYFSKPLSREEFEIFLKSNEFEHTAGNSKK